MTVTAAESDIARVASCPGLVDRVVQIVIGLDHAQQGAYIRRLLSDRFGNKPYINRLLFNAALRVAHRQGRIRRYGEAIADVRWGPP